jgi:mono/diheme cytochrome c family protein
MKGIIFRVLITLFILSVFSGCLGAGDGVETKTPTPTTTTISPSSTSTTSVSPTQTTSTPVVPKEDTSFVTLKITDTSGNPLNGIAGFEKGFVHKGRYLMGVKFSEGIATIELPKISNPETLVSLLDNEYIEKTSFIDWRNFKIDEERFWGLHVYVSDHIYFPKELEILPGQDYEFEIALAPEPNPSDDPVISSITFEKRATDVAIKAEIRSPINHLGPQDLIFNSKTGEMFVLTPPTAVASLQEEFPNGIYTFDYSDPETDPKDWFVIVADEACSNGPLQGYPVNENIIPALAEGEAPKETEAPAGTPVDIGAQIVSARGCKACHYFDRESRFEDKEAQINWLVGPGLKGVFKKEKLPASGRDATDENVEQQILEGGGGMPSYSYLSEEEISNINAYLTSL